MGIVDKVKEFLAPGVRQKLGEAETNLAELEGRLAPLYLGELLDPGVAAERKKLEREVADVRATVERLRLAAQEAAKRDYAASAEERIAAFKAKQGEFEKVLAAHGEAAGELDAAVEALARSYRRLQATSELLRSTAPLGLPTGYVRIHPRQLLGHQLHRVSGAGAALGAAEGVLPGAHAPTLQVLHRADAVETAAETIGAEVEYLQAAARRSIADAAATLRDEPSAEEAA